jgi:hypothetical protein
MILLSILLQSFAPVTAQVYYPVDTLQYSGNVDKFINLVIISDGYLNTELTKFHYDAAVFDSSFFMEPPFINYKNYFNIFSIDVPSPESGAKHPGTAPDCGSAIPPVPISNPNNYFGSTFDYAYIHRLVVPQYTYLVMNVLADNLPQYDIALVLVNSPYYGGSGGYYATSTTDDASTEISKHEIGHSFADLADEYWSGYFGEMPNMTQQSDPSLIRWKNWLNFNGIGIYPYPSHSDWFKPSHNCKMEFLYNLFCSVCTEALVETIHNLVNPVLSFTPDNTTVVPAQNDPILFSLKTIKPVPNTLRRRWHLDGSPFGYNVDSVYLDAGTLSFGLHHMDAMVIDTISLSRDSLHSIDHLYTIQWDIGKYPEGITIKGNSNVFMVNAWPNPFTEKLLITYQADRAASMGIDILDNNGRLIRTIQTAKEEDGRHQVSLAEDLFGSAGLYFIRFTMDGITYNKPVIHR